MGGAALIPAPLLPSRRRAQRGGGTDAHAVAFTPQRLRSFVAPPLRANGFRDKQPHAQRSRGEPLCLCVFRVLRGEGSSWTRSQRDRRRNSHTPTAPRVDKSVLISRNSLRNARGIVCMQSAT